MILGISIVHLIYITSIFGNILNGPEKIGTQNSIDNFNIEIIYANTSNSTECKFEDGTYSSSVEYYNPETEYSATYTLDVDVSDCQIVKIHFPKGGYLDDDNISFAEIDDDGYAKVEGENGKIYEVNISE